MKSVGQRSMPMPHLARELFVRQWTMPAIAMRVRLAKFGVLATRLAFAGGFGTFREPSKATSTCGFSSRERRIGLGLAA